MLDGVYVECQDQNILRFLKLYIYESKYLFVCLSVVCSLKSLSKFFWKLLFLKLSIKLSQELWDPIQPLQSPFENNISQIDNRRTDTWTIILTVWAPVRAKTQNREIDQSNQQSLAESSKQYSDAFGKLYIWNMTQYKIALWLDSDTMVLKNLQPLLDLSARLPMPGSSEKGPR